jgi:hypothetical protein
MGKATVRGLSGGAKKSDFCTRERQKVLYSILYSSPSNFPKFFADLRYTSREAAKSEHQKKLYCSLITY